MNTSNFDYTFLKSELTGEIMLIIKCEPHWLNNDIEVNVHNEEMEIIVNNQFFNSGKLPPIVYDWLKHNVTTIYFANDDGIIVSEIKIDIGEM